jgi:hypothetical protein
MVEIGPEDLGQRVPDPRPDHAGEDDDEQQLAPSRRDRGDPGRQAEQRKRKARPDPPERASELADGGDSLSEWLGDVVAEGDEADEGEPRQQKGIEEPIHDTIRCASWSGASLSLDVQVAVRPLRARGGGAALSDC